MSRKVLSELRSPRSLIKDIKETKRPVTEKDTWCYFSKNHGDLVNPHGYIFSLPYGKSIDLTWLPGYIVRSKRKGSLILIQVIKMTQQTQHYMIKYIKVVTPKIVTDKARKYTIHFTNITSKKL